MNRRGTQPSFRAEDLAQWIRMLELSGAEKCMADDSPMEVDWKLEDERS